MSQTDKILNLLKDGKWHSTIELHQICWRYGARLFDMREQGYKLEKRPSSVPKIEEWRLIETLENTFVPITGIIKDKKIEYFSDKYKKIMEENKQPSLQI